MEKLKEQSPLYQIIETINTLLEIIPSSIDSFKNGVEYKETKTILEFQKEIFKVKVSGIYRISMLANGNVVIKGNNGKRYDLNANNKEIDGILLLAGDMLNFESTGMQITDVIKIELTSSILDYVTKNADELRKAIELYKPLNYEKLNPEQIEALRGEPFRYNDFTPTQLNDLKGKSAYQVWLDNGNKGTEKDFLISLKGRDGSINFDNLTPAQKAEITPDLSPYAKKEEAKIEQGAGILIEGRTISIDSNTLNHNNEMWANNNIFSANGFIPKSKIQAITKRDVGLGSVYNYSLATQSEAESGTTNNKYMTPYRTTQHFNKYFLQNFTQSFTQNFKSNLVNNLTTGGTDKALTAEQGKILFQNVDSGKNKIANAIIDKGQSGVSKDSTFDELASKISSIQNGYGKGSVLPLDNLEEVFSNPIKGWEFTGHSQYIKDIHFADDSLYSVDTYTSLYKINASTGRRVWVANPADQRMMAISDNGDYVYVLHYLEGLIKISKSLGTVVTTFNGGFDPFISNTFIAVNNYFYVANYDNELIKLGEGVSRLTWKYASHTKRISCLTSDGGNNIFTGGEDSRITKINANTGIKVWEIFGFQNGVYDISYGDGFLYASDQGGKVYKIDAQTSKKSWEVSFTGKTPIKVKYKDKKLYIGLSGSKLLKLDPNTGEVLWEENLTGEWVRALDAGGNRIFLSTSDSSNKILSYSGGEKTGYKILS